MMHNRGIRGWLLPIDPGYFFDDSPVLQPGESYRFTFVKPGTYDYFCGPHPQMQGIIEVK